MERWFFKAMEGDADAEVFPEIRFSDDQACATLPVSALLKVGLHDVDQIEIQRILPMMTECRASEPFLTKRVLSDKNFGSVPRTYVRTSVDKMISPVLQDAVIANWEVDSVFELESGHFPTSSMLDDLARVLLRAASVGISQRAGNA